MLQFEFLSNFCRRKTPLAIEPPTQQVKQLSSFQHVSTVPDQPTVMYAGQTPSQMYIHTGQVYGLSNPANGQQQFRPLQVQILAVNRSSPDPN